MDEARDPLRGRRDLPRNYRFLWSATAGTLFVCGVLAAVLVVPLTALVGLFLAVGIMTGGSLWAWSSVEPAAARWALPAFVGSGAVALASVGLADLFGGWGLLMALGCGLAAPALVERVVPRLTAWTSGGNPAGRRGAPEDGTTWVADDLRFDDPHACRLLDPVCPTDGKPLLADLSAGDLGRIWKVSGRWLRRGFDGPDAAHLVAVRASCLDELERRDPKALQRWLAGGHASTTEPTRYLDAS